MFERQEAPNPRAGVWRPLGRRIARLLGRCARPCVRFLGLAWPGAALGLIVAALFFPVYGGLCIGTGLGTVIDVVGALLLGAIGLSLATGILLLVLALTRRVPLLFKALFIVAFASLLAVATPFGFSPGFALRLGGPLLVLSMLTGAGVALLLRRRSRGIGLVCTFLASLLVIAGLSVGAALVYWLAVPGDDPFLPDIYPIADDRVAPLEAPDPSQTGDYEVATLFYGSGTDRHRPEYAEEVDWRTDPVDASAFISNPKGFKGWTRRRYWGFEPNSLPLNARVWLPKGEGPFPLVLVVHGNHKMEEFSDPGYAYLGELLASRGFILASIDENFLNASWSGDLGDENDARGWLLLKHLERWRAWNSQEDHPLQGRVDLSQIALIGHSRGGEAILHAAAFNRLPCHPEDAKVTFHFGFAIRTLIAIAPVDGQYEPVGLPVPVENVHYLVLQGSHDSDLDFFAGTRSYRRLRFTDDHYWMKAALYIHRANHGQFNTVWGPYDAGPPLQHLLARGALLPGEDQRRIAKVYLCAFLEATLRGKGEYIPMFRDHRRALRWLPETVYFSRFEDSEFRVVSNFDESIDVTKTTVEGGSQAAANLGVWRHREMEGRGGWPFHDRAAVVGWNTGPEPNDSPDSAPRYTITLPEGLARRWQLNAETVLSFCLADTDETCEPKDGKAAPAPDPNTEPNQPRHPPASDEEKTAIDLTVELVASDGVSAALPLSHVHPIQPVLKITFTKWPYWERTRFKSAVEPVLQTFEMPLLDFVAAHPDFDPARLKQIRFRFDRTESAVILLDQVGFANRPRRGDFSAR